MFQRVYTLFGNYRNGCHEDRNSYVLIGFKKHCLFVVVNIIIININISVFIIIIRTTRIIIIIIVIVITLGAHHPERPSPILSLRDNLCPD